MQQNIQKYEYLLDNTFFQSVGGDVQKGNVKVVLIVTKGDNDIFNLIFKFNGTVVIPCDRCLDDMDFCINVAPHLIVKFGRDYAEEGDETIIIPQSEGSIDIVWFLHEVIVLEIPIRNIHIQEKCNHQMLAKLKEHEIESMSEGMREEIDSRWETLKKININS